jgi:hypothetical protein
LVVPQIHTEAQSAQRLHREEEFMPASQERVRRVDVLSRSRERGRGEGPAAQTLTPTLSRQREREPLAS